MDKIDFIDGVERNEECPDTFHIPSTSEKLRIATEDYVKVATGGERFWVSVKSIDGEQLKGEVNNHLVCSDEHGLEFGDVIELKMKNVLSIIQN